MSNKFNLGKYNLGSVEEHWNDTWNDMDIYSFDDTEPRENNFVIDTPPPTVSGVLHIGHVFSYTQTDYQARFFRMNGKNVFYPIGFDDNGLPTERLVEKLKKVRASDMTREEFVKICHDVAQDSEKDFRTLFKDLAISYDWDQEYSTISPHSWKISQLSLIDLFNKGHLYREPQPTLWDPADKTAIAQAEIVEKPKNGVMYHIPFNFDTSETITIATTRPELLPACVAVFYHPEDKRKKLFQNQVVYSPLIGAKVPLIADMSVDPEKGTGLVMCCTFGDPVDIEWWRTYHLPLRDIVNKSGRLGNMERLGDPDWPVANKDKAQEVVSKLSDLTVNKARIKILEMLDASDLILKQESIEQMIPTAERSGAPIEILVTKQWMIRILDKKDKLLEMGRKITWHPEFMQKRFEDWVKNIKWDWCISRQRYFGVPLPFWYSKRKGEEGKLLLPDISQLPINPLVDLPMGYEKTEVKAETDVLDTWATSSVTPQINSHGVSDDLALNAERHSKLFPADMRPQAHEIIRTWTFYTVLKSLLHEGTLPFNHAAISGWCLAEGGGKMSKSKGNIVKPDNVLKQYGSDVIRYWSANAKLGKDTAYSEDILKIGRRLTLKLWNSSNLISSHIQPMQQPSDNAVSAIMDNKITEVFDLWILRKLHNVIIESTKNFNNYDYSAALEVVESFFWKDYCDNYLEVSKGRLYGGVNPKLGSNTSVYNTYYFSHLAILSLFAPFLPYVTEELYTKLYPEKLDKVKSIHSRGNWPKVKYFPNDDSIMQGAEVGILILNSIRKYKSVRQVSMKEPIHKMYITLLGDMRVHLQVIKDCLDDLNNAIHCGEIIFVDELPQGLHILDTDNKSISLGIEETVA